MADRDQRGFDDTDVGGPIDAEPGINTETRNRRTVGGEKGQDDDLDQEWTDAASYQGQGSAVGRDTASGTRQGGTGIDTDADRDQGINTGGPANEERSGTHGARGSGSSHGNQQHARGSR